MHFPGERVQVDVKFVPEVCIVGDAKGEKFYQYTAIDEFSRWRYLEAFQEHSSYYSAVFLEHLIKAAPFKILCIQTDNGTEFTKKFVSDKARPHLFKQKLNFQKQLAVHSREYNHFPIRPLGWLDPLAFLAKYRNHASAPAV